MRRRNKLFALFGAMLLTWACQGEAPPQHEAETSAPPTAPDGPTEPEAPPTEPVADVGQAKPDASAQPKAVLEPVAQALIEDLATIRPDPHPEELTQGHSYVVSDEFEHYLFRDTIQDLGGIYVGLGPDQNYLLGGWAKPDVMILFDFDQYVVDLHYLYGALFKTADTPEAFLGFWRKDGKDAVHAAIAEHYPDQSNRLQRIYERGRRKIERRLDATLEICQPRGVKSFLDDPEQYRYIAELWRQGRVHPVRGDLTKDKAMADISKIAKKHEMPIRVVYLSNAEYYFPFEAGSYRDNITGLHVDERSVMLHTYPRSKKFYRYIDEKATVYQAWLKSEKAVDFRDLIRKASKKIHGHLYTITALPNGKDPGKAEREKRRDDAKAAAEQIPEGQGAVEVRSKPPGFIVVNGERRWVGTPGRIHLPEGKYELQVAFDNDAECEKQEVEVKAGKTVEVKFEAPQEPEASAEKQAE